MKGRVGNCRAAALSAALFLLTGLLLLSACQTWQRPAAPVELIGEEILANPTAHGVQVSILPVEAVEVYATYGPIDVSADRDVELRQKTGSLKRRAGELAVFSIDELAPGTRHRVQLHLRRPGERGFHSRPALEFRTLYAEAEASVRFAYAADSHIVGRYIAALCRPTWRMLERLADFQRTLDNILASQVDFVIAGGDNFMTPQPETGGLREIESLRVGNRPQRRRGRSTLRAGFVPEPLGASRAAAPILYMSLAIMTARLDLVTQQGSYGHFSDTRALSRGARLRHLADPTAVYGESQDGDLYFTFTSGPARFIILDVMSGPRELSSNGPEDWTLGDAQKEWFEAVLAEQSSALGVRLCRASCGRGDEPRRPSPPLRVWASR